MLKYEGNVAYDLSLFDDNAQQNIDDVFIPRPELLKKKAKSLKQRKYEAKVNAFKMVRVIGTTAALLSCVGLLIMARAQLTENTDKLAKMEKNYAVVQSEGVRLNMELSSLASLDKVEDYARDVLGMTKQEKNQVEYVDLSAGNKLVLSDSQKDVSFFEQLKAKFSSFLEYLS